MTLPDILTKLNAAGHTFKTSGGNDWQATDNNAEGTYRVVSIVNGDEEGDPQQIELENTPRGKSSRYTYYSLDDAGVEKLIDKIKG